MERGFGVFTISVLAVAIAISFVALYPYAVDSPSLSPGEELAAGQASAIGPRLITTNVCLNNICQVVKIPPWEVPRIGGGSCSPIGSSCGGAPQVCSDSDVNSQYPDGINPFTNGIIFGTGDACLSGTLLQENYCATNSSAGSTQIDCSQYNAPVCGNPGPCFQKPMVCFNGACVANQTYRLDVIKTGSGADDGQVNSLPAGSGIDCGSDCYNNYLRGSEVVLDAFDYAASFINWTGCDFVSDIFICHVIMNSNRQVTAEFEQLVPQYETITLTRSGSDKMRIDADFPPFKIINYAKDIDNSSGFIPILADSNGDRIRVREGESINSSEYVILGEDGNARLLRVETIYNGSAGYSGDYVTLRDFVTGEDIFGPVSPISEGVISYTIDGLVYTIHYYGSATSAMESRYIIIDYPPSVPAVSPEISLVNGTKIALGTAEDIQIKYGFDCGTPAIYPVVFVRNAVDGQGQVCVSVQDVGGQIGATGPVANPSYVCSPNGSTTTCVDVFGNKFTTNSDYSMSAIQMILP